MQQDNMDWIQELSQEKAGSPLGEYYINPGMPDLLRKSAAEGLVLLKNDGTLPIDPEKTVSVFGRCQLDYFYVGYGSGGDVNPPYLVNLIDGLTQTTEISLNESLLDTYRKWTAREENRPLEGSWGQWPTSHEEMPLEPGVIQDAAQNSQIAIVVIGRAAGEDRESLLEKGSYYLTDAETDMLNGVTSAFEHVVVLLDCGNIMDLSWTEVYGERISALVYAWQGGMESGRALADVLSGRTNFSGRLADSIASRYEDYPSSRCFGHREYNQYEEDIYVGYRYFETFAPEKVLYPFGFGLSYTSFEKKLTNFTRHTAESRIEVEVKNVGRTAGKAVVQLYASAPQGKLGKAVKSLVAFQKTTELGPAESQTVELIVPDYYVTSFDDVGKCGHPSAYVLEAGLYRFHLGDDVSRTEPVASFSIDETMVVQQLEVVMPVKESFARMIPGELREDKYELNWESLPSAADSLKERILSRLPEPIDPALKREVTLSFKDVMQDAGLLDAFVLQLSKEELEALTRGQGGMNSPLGTEGNAGAYGGIIDSLQKKAVPPVITTDGPAGIRLQRYCSLLPCGTALACSWNPPLVEALHVKLGEEMVYYGSDVLLSPGMNIHRNPLCGRNFEYFSEDPLLTGKMATAVVKGVQSQGVAACPKHFAMNNQETNRNYHDSRLSERAAREIYLKAFEIVVKEAGPLNVMTAYNKINGIWAHYHYDLVTTVLRGEWGFGGVVITDWWMRYTRSPEFPNLNGNAYRVRAGVDVLMPGGVTQAETEYVSDGSLLETFGIDGGITLAELQRTARHVLQYIRKRQK